MTERPTGGSPDLHAAAAETLEFLEHSGNERAVLSGKFATPSARYDWFQRVRKALREALSSGALREAPPTERGLRELLWLRHGCPVGALYGDDGEMSCGACGIDFKQWSGEQIAARFKTLGEAALRSGPALREAAPATETAKRTAFPAQVPGSRCDSTPRHDENCKLTRHDYEAHGAWGTPPGLALMQCCDVGCSCGARAGEAAPPPKGSVELHGEFARRRIEEQGPAPREPSE